MDSENLYRTALAAVRPMQLRGSGEAGQVACALESADGQIFTGVCIDLPCSLGFCAEQAAMAQMIAQGQTRIRRIVAVQAGGAILPPCGRCREFMVQIDAANGETAVLLPALREVPLRSLLPAQWNEG